MFVGVPATDKPTYTDPPTHRCHSEPAPYGWAVRRISLWAETVQGCAVNEKSPCPPSGGDPSPCGVQDDTRGAGRVTLKDLNQARQQDPPRRMSFITLPNNRQKFTHPTLSFRAGPIRMGRAKNLPVGGKGAGVCSQCYESLPAFEGEILPAVGRRKRTACGRQDDSVRECYMCLLACPPAGGRYSPPLAGASEPPAGVRMTHAGRGGITRVGWAGWC